MLVTAKRPCCICGHPTANLKGIFNYDGPGTGWFPSCRLPLKCKERVEAKTVARLSPEPDYTEAPTLGRCSFCDAPIHREYLAKLGGARRLVNEDENADCPKAIFGRHELRRK